jgi:hypothetical protein
MRSPILDALESEKSEKIVEIKKVKRIPKNFPKKVKMQTRDKESIEISEEMLSMFSNEEVGLNRFFFKF